MKTSYITFAIALVSLSGCATLTTSQEWDCLAGECNIKGYSIEGLTRHNNAVTKDVESDYSANEAVKNTAQAESIQALPTPVPAVQLEKQHYYLVYLVKVLQDAINQGNGEKVLGTIFDGIMYYTVSNFTSEKMLMVDSGYPELAEHENHHRELSLKIKLLKKELKQGNPLVAMEVLKFLKEDLIIHIAVDDKNFEKYSNTIGVVNNNWVKSK